MIRILDLLPVGPRAVTCRPAVSHGRTERKWGASQLTRGGNGSARNQSFCTWARNHSGTVSGREASITGTSCPCVMTGDTTDTIVFQHVETPNDGCPCANSSSSLQNGISMDLTFSLDTLCPFIVEENSVRCAGLVSANRQQWAAAKSPRDFTCSTGFKQFRCRVSSARDQTWTRPGNGLSRAFYVG